MIAVGQEKAKPRITKVIWRRRLRWS